VIDLELRNITKRFGDFTAVENFSIAAEEGEFISFLGPSGCGKTTTLRMIAGFIEPTAGEILIKGQKVNRVPPHQRDTGMVFQNYALFPHMNVFDNIAFGLRYRNVPKSEYKQRVREMLQLVHLPHIEGRRPSQLSGGQQQRIALARAMIIKPKVLLFDEPLSNLDAKLRENLRVELRQIQKEVGITAIFVTHDQEEALALSDRIVVMKDGQITQIGSPFDIYEKPVSEFVGDFIGQSNFIDGRVQSIAAARTVVSLPGDLRLTVNSTEDLQVDDPVKILIRAERIRVLPSDADIGAGDDCNNFDGTVEELSYLGSNVYYYVRLANKERVLAIEQTGEKAPFARNDPVILQFGVSSCRSFRKSKA
jgi:putative spermidine/putrescine transport system ATP-binding protein